MKIIIVLLKLVGIFLALAALGAFAIELMPVEGIDIGSWDNSNGETHFFKIVPSEKSINAVWYGITLILLSASCFFSASALKRKAK